jgi:hypothetical protein
MPNLPPKRTGPWKSCFSTTLYKSRNAIGRMSVAQLCHLRAM